MRCARSPPLQTSRIDDAFPITIILQEERSFAQKEAVEAIAELKAATAAVEASWSMAENAVKADDEQAARLLLENKAKKKEAMEKALKKVRSPTCRRNTPGRRASPHPCTAPASRRRPASE